MTKAATVVLVLFVLAASVGPFSKTIRSHITTWSHDIGGFLHPSYREVQTLGAATSNSSSPAHPPSFAFDQKINTSWQTADNPPKNGVGDEITIVFTEPVTLNKVGFYNGDQDTSSSYQTLARPQQVHLTFIGATTTSQDITLADVSTFQTFGVSARKTTSVEVSIISAYPPPVPTQAAIAEIEFFTKEY